MTATRARLIGAATFVTTAITGLRRRIPDTRDPDYSLGQLLDRALADVEPTHRPRFSDRERG